MSAAIPVVFTEGAVARLRDVFRKSSPSYRAAHVAEAVARGFGFATNAALVADLKSRSKAVASIGSFDADAADGRLADLASADAADGEGVFAAAAAAAGIAVVNEGYDGLSSRIGGRGPTKGFEQVVNAMFLLLWRWYPVDVIYNFSDDLTPKPMPLLAAVVQQRAYLDPEIAAFLIDYILAALRPLPTGTPPDTRWGDAIISAYRPRIRRFLDIACMTWPVDAPVDTFSPPTEMRRQRRAIITVGLGAGHLSSADCGLQEGLTMNAVVGLAAMAMWRAGEPHGEIIRRVEKGWRIEDEEELAVLFNGVVDIGSLPGMLKRTSTTDAYMMSRDSRRLILSSDYDKAIQYVEQLRQEGTRVLVADRGMSPYKAISFANRMDTDGVLIDLRGLRVIDERDLVIIRRNAHLGQGVIVVYDEETDLESIRTAGSKFEPVLDDSEYGCVEM